MKVFKQSIIFTVFIMLMLIGIILATTPISDIANNLVNIIAQYVGYAIITFVITVGAFSIEGM